MSKYVMAFRGQADRTTSDDNEAAWGKWFQEIGVHVVDFGNRVGQVRAVGDGTGTGAERDVLTGYVIITANNLDAAVTVAQGCPGLGSGGAVEVGEIIANP